ncbi:MAG: transposase [Actinomycetia bacterium]|nr:transposase [Actinomycetes bacterium]
MTSTLTKALPGDDLQVVATARELVAAALMGLPEVLVDDARTRDGRPTPLGDAIAHYGRIPKTLHILRMVDEPTYRHEIKAQSNLQEGRHALARRIFHGKRGHLYQRYQEGMEDQLGALGLVLNAVVLFNTRYMDAALAKLRIQGFAVRDEDVARLSPFIHAHVNMLGHYSFALPELPGGLRTFGESVDIHPDRGIGG